MNYCVTRILFQNKKKVDLQYDILGNKITFCLFNKVFNYRKTLLEKIKKAENVLKYTIINDDQLTILIKLEVDMFMTKFKTQNTIKIHNYLKEIFVVTSSLSISEIESILKF